jgi:hypothetical protein
MKLMLGSVAVLACLATVPAAAQFNPNATTSSDELKILSTGPFSPVGTYTGQLLASPGQPMLDIWCNDFFNGIQSPQVVNVTRFDASVADFNARTRFGHANWDNYRKAAVLATYLRVAPNVDIATDIHWALWRFFGANPGAVRLGEAAWVATANLEYTLINPQDWFVISGERRCGPNNDQICGQEFITQVPEPAGMVLIATGLIGLAGATRLRRRQQKG